jgi:predicted short-subunit dehydrogenase-like oxidoreductase (DUF2520 family)
MALQQYPVFLRDPEYGCKAFSYQSDNHIMTDIKRMSLIGAGNVATHLGRGFSSTGIQIDSVYSRQLDNARILASQINATPVNSIRAVCPDSELYLICASDDAILPLANQLCEVVHAKALIVHTSGSTPSLTRLPCRPATGVLYPLQSFNRYRSLDLSDIPFLITASGKSVQEQLVALAMGLSRDVRRISDEERLILHIAAVFANNFTNYLFTVAEDMLQKKQLDFNLLRPLIRETVDRILEARPVDVQTGPARRNDLVTIDKHLKTLKNNPTVSAVYSLLSQAIMGYYAMHSPKQT